MTKTTDSPLLPLTGGSQMSASLQSIELADTSFQHLARLFLLCGPISALAVKLKVEIFMQS